MKNENFVWVKVVCVKRLYDSVSECRWFLFCMEFKKKKHLMFVPLDIGF